MSGFTMAIQQLLKLFDRQVMKQGHQLQIS
jgi:hypothetical protein